MLILRKLFALRAQADGEGAEPGGAAVADNQNVDAGGAGGDNGADAAQQQVEARARAMGWTPKDEFKGDPAKWRDAGEFVERGENLLPLVKAQNKRLEREVAELKQTTREFAEHLSKTEQRAYERALADLKLQRKEALAAGDGDAFEKVDDQIDKLKREAEAKAAKRADKHDDGAGADPVYTEWESRNTWLKDAELSEYAEFAAQKLRAGGEKATGAEFLDLVAERVKKQFPAKFTNPRRETAQAVEGAAPAARRSGKSYADMPAEARAACDRMAKNGFGGDEKAMAKFKADYVKNYFEEA